MALTRLSSALLGLAQRELVQPGEPFAALQFGQHVGRLQAEGRQRDHRVEPQVGHLGDDACARSPSLAAITISVASSPIFFRIASVPLREQARDVALVGVAAAARLDHLRQARQRVAATSGSACPCRSFVDALRIFQDRLDAVPRAVLVALEEARVPPGVAGDRRLVAELRRPSAAPRRCRSRGGSRAPAARGPTPRPCATGGCASGSSTPPRRARPCCASASRFMKANISTSLLPTSCAITGTRPSRVPLHCRRASPCGTSVVSRGASGRRSRARRRTSAAPAACPAAPAPPRTGSVCHAIAWPSRISNVAAATRTPCRSAAARARAGSPSARPATAARRRS